jgi:23S rRNA pseudouridine1911/1915/1917 synthase
VRRPRAFTVDRAGAGRPLAEWLGGVLAVDRSTVLRLIAGRRVFVGGVPCLDRARRLRRGDRVTVLADLPDKPVRGGPLPPPRAARPRHNAPVPAIRYADDQVVVVDKPAGLTTMRHAEEALEHGRRAQRYLPPTLQELLPELLSKSKGARGAAVRAVHRLDKETSGLVVFARTAAAESHLGKQFRARATERLYLALARGKARDARIESWLIRDRGDGRRGSGAAPDVGQKAVTHVRVVERLGQFTLVECRLETGRTHQVRIHLGEAGTPLCGERVYDRPLHGRPLPDGSGARRIMLHAAALGFLHPTSGKRMHWKANLPDDMAALLRRLRSGNPPKPAD